MRRDSLLKSIDWITVGIYLLLVIFGWFSVCGASYDYSDRDFLDFSTRAGKQMVWILCSFGLGFVLLMLDDGLYEVFSYIIYIGMLALLVITIFVAKDIKGSHSWLVFGPVSLQPAEFAKFATALALARFIGSYNFTLAKMSNFLGALVIIFLPMLLIIAQRETGSALAYFAFFLMLYREGMSGAVIFSGIAAVVYFVVGLRYGEVMLEEGQVTPVGPFLVLILVMLFSVGMIYVYLKRVDQVRRLISVGAAVLLPSLCFSLWLYPFNLVGVCLFLCLSLALYLIYCAIDLRKIQYFFIALFTLCSVAFLFSCNYVFTDILEPHQQVRIKVVLGMEDDLAGAGYNVNQSKIAIGSGGLVGKGFLRGTQTKLKYVPEQDTDFIFCTIGEEQGFVGSSVVLVLFLALILRLIYLSERQDTTFARVYGYCTLSVFLFHLFINVGMVLGLTPVIGIPLPFFSYGGSSLWGFSILLFVFLRLDAGRRGN